MKWRDCVTEEDRWQWHSEVYAFRRVILGASVDERTSPVDPTGIWFDENRVREAAAALQAKRHRYRGGGHA